MSSSADLAALAHLLPEAKLGTVSALRTISQGLSGAAVYEVSASRGEFVLRINAELADPVHLTQQLRVLSRAAELGVAPKIVHVDEPARAVVSERVRGVVLHLALAEPAQRPAVITGIVAQLRTLHRADASGLDARDPIAFARMHCLQQHERAGFPAWASGAGAILDALERTLARDPRVAVSHNDVNPGNVLWDGTRAVLVDWESAGLTHPFYDLATLAMFLQLPDDAAFGLLALQEQRAPSEQDRATFAALRRLSGLSCGLVLASMVPDLRELPADPPVLSDVYAAMTAGTLDLQQPIGRGTFGLALLRRAIDGTA